MIEGIKVKLCKCGCGNEVKYEKTYIRGHNRRGEIGCRLGKHHTEQSRLKMSEAMKGKIPWNKGKHGIWSEEAKAVLRRSAKLQWEIAKINDIPIGMVGRKHSEETRAKLVQSHIGKHPTIEQNIKNSNKHKGKLNHFYGKHHTEESLIKMSKAHSGKHLTEEHKAKISRGNRGKVISEEQRIKDAKAHIGKLHTEETKIRLRQITLKQWQDSEFVEKQLRYRRKQWQNPEFVIKQMKSRGVKPNKTEKLLGNILSVAYPEFQYNGDGRLGIVLAGLVPDYVNVNGGKQVIECFGEYWHRRKNIKWHQTEEGRIATYKTMGWDCLVIWEDELKMSDSVKAKIDGFIKARHESLQFRGSI